MTAYTRLAKSQARQNSTPSKQWDFSLRQKKKSIKEYIGENIRDHNWSNVAKRWSYIIDLLWVSYEKKYLIWEYLNNNLRWAADLDVNYIFSK